MAGRDFQTESWVFSFRIFQILLEHVAGVRVIALIAEVQSKGA